ncbi:hypothetical protein FRC01_002990, partial [Tulasnella sp. 417]
QDARSAALLEKFGDLESWKGNHKEASAYLEQALHLYEEEGNDKAIADVLRKQAAAAFRDSNLTKTRTAASAALGKCKSLQDNIGVADALYWMGGVGYAPRHREENWMGTPGIYVEGEALLWESVRVARSCDEGWRLAQPLRRLGKHFHQQGRFAEAILALEEACSLDQKFPKQSFNLNLARATSLVASSKSMLGHLEEALAWYDVAIDEWRKGGSQCDGEISNCLAEKNAILEVMNGPEEGVSHSEPF